MRKSENQEMRESDELPGEYDIPRQSPADMIDEALRLVQHWRGLHEKQTHEIMRLQDAIDTATSVRIEDEFVKQQLHKRIAEMEMLMQDVKKELPNGA